MNADRYHLAWTIGFDEAAALLNEDEWDDLYALDDQAHPEAFSYALEQIPEYEAPEISEAVHAGIQAAFEKQQSRYARESYGLSED